MNRESYKVNLVARASLAAIDHHRFAIGTILHPTDYSAASRQAFEMACRIARERGSRLVVMHVAEPVRRCSFGMAPVPPLPKGYRGAWESRLRLVHPPDRNLAIEHRLEEGDVADAILRVGRDVQADMIVMAGSERSWLSRLWTRSITDKVTLKAPCPIFKMNVQSSAKLVMKGDGVGRAKAPSEITAESRELNGGENDTGPHNSAPDRLLALHR
jgi:universal stress protein A